jgi:MoaA/NifB/PqqE/SkfB family radical SAM enzyme
VSARPETPTTGVLFPEVPALVARDADGFVLLDANGARTRISGLVCAEIEASLDDGAVSPGLRRLASAHPSLNQLAKWLGTRSVPLSRLDAVRLDGFDTLFIELLGRCNERCVHCYADAAPTVTAALEQAAVMKIIDEAVAAGFRRIQFTGGDPLLCDFLPAAVKHARECGVSHVEIFTNGLALTESLADELAPYRPAFAFSFYSLDPDAHDAVTRTPGSQRRTLAAVDRVVARGLESRVAIVAVEPDTDVQEMIDHLRERGVGFVSWTRTYAVGRGGEIAGAGEAPASRSGTANLAEGGGHRAPGDGRQLGRGKLCITYNGDVVPCIFNRGSVLGNISDGRSLVDIVSHATRGRSLVLRALAPANDAGNRLQCSSCRLTELALDWLAIAS